MICKTALSLLAALSFAGLSNAATIGQLGVLDSASGLSAGDQYRLVFLTSVGTTATSSDITTYNAFVQGVAASSTTFANLGDATWNIVGSTLAVDARDNTGTNPGTSTGVPIFLMDGTTAIALDNADLWNGIATPITLDENGAAIIENRAFTGTLGNGTKVTGTGDQPLGNFGDGLGNIRTGDSAKFSGSWMTDFNSPHTDVNSVFAMSEILTAVPEPSSLALLGLGGLMIARRRRA